MENGGAYYVVHGSNNNKITFRPNVTFTGDATSFISEPPAVGIEIQPNSFIIKVVFGEISNNLNPQVYIMIEDNKTMKIRGSFTASVSNVYTRPRILRVCPRAEFCASFDFPAPSGVSDATASALSAYRLSNGTIKINIPRPAGVVDLRPYRCVRG